MTGMLIGMVTAGVVTAFGEKICNVIGQPDFAQYTKVTGISLAGATALGAVITLIGKLKSFAG